MTTLSIIVPAHQEAGHIGNCLNALLQQRVPPGHHVELVIVPNGCTDDTAEIARDWIAAFRKSGWSMRIVETPTGGKAHALNLGDDAATGELRCYLDADIEVAGGMVEGLFTALDCPGPRYAGARLVVSPASNNISRIYARFWQKLPFVAQGVTGAGLFAVNAEGRQRWQRFPDLISDDGFVRLNFAPAERKRVEVDYLWPISEGLGTLVRVRRRQDAGIRQLRALHPELAANDTGDRPDRRAIRHLATRDPIGFLVYSAVALLVRLGRAPRTWTRGR
ncbi:glycosyltransferase [Paracoccus zeaxanthinifaciens]|uniref:glycosyltransferase n=1 Tax=Paracoccus zeaxanthinifaciens TaxID=187400 RepID=UPI0003B6963D|nr:glycosyltransferase [Paracoccus zeaxanthinifaciens]